MENEKINENQNSIPSLKTDKLYANLLRCSHALLRGHRRDGAHPGQLRILARIAAEEGLSQSDLLDETRIRPSSLSEILTKLELKGYLTRAKTESDKRLVRLHLTDEGRDYLAELHGEHTASSAQMFSALTEEEQMQLSALLDKLLEKWNEEYPIRDRIGHDRMRGGEGMGMGRGHGRLHGNGHGHHGPHVEHED